MFFKCKMLFDGKIITILISILFKESIYRSIFKTFKCLYHENKRRVTFMHRNINQSINIRNVKVICVAVAVAYSMFVCRYRHCVHCVCVTVGVMSEHLTIAYKLLSLQTEYENVLLCWIRYHHEIVRSWKNDLVSLISWLKKTLYCIRWLNICLVLVNLVFPINL